MTAQRKNLKKASVFSRKSLLVFVILFAVMGGYAIWRSFAAGSCSINDTASCVAGTSITLNDAQWVCNKALSSYGTLPIKVTITADTIYNVNAAADITSGCAGDSDPSSIDLILDVRGDGLTYGPGQDAVKVRLDAGASNGIEITGSANCGKRIGTSHQDGIQLQGGRNISFVNFNIGNYDGGISTCEGAGGAVFYSGANGYFPENVNIIGGKYITCNHGLFGNSGGSATGSITSANFRTGRTDGSDPACVGYTASSACISSLTQTNVGCQQWDSSSHSWSGSQSSSSSTSTSSSGTSSGSTSSSSTSSGGSSGSSSSSNSSSSNGSTSSSSGSSPGTTNKKTTSGSSGSPNNAAGGNSAVEGANSNTQGSTPSISSTATSNSHKKIFIVTAVVIVGLLTLGAFLYPKSSKSLISILKFWK